MDDTEKLIEEQRKSLPPDLLKAIDATPWKSLVQEIGRGNALDAEQMTALERETMFILFGFENPANYVSNIVSNVGMKEDVATAISDAVAEKILSAIENKMTSNEGVAAEPHNLPMLEEGEKAHDVSHVESLSDRQAPPPASQARALRAGPSATTNPPQAEPAPNTKPEVSVPDYRYPDGPDPYREPTN